MGDTFRFLGGGGEANPEIKMSVWCEKHTVVFKGVWAGTAGSASLSPSLFTPTVPLYTAMHAFSPPHPPSRPRELFML